MLWFNVLCFLGLVPAGQYLGEYIVLHVVVDT